MGAWHGPGGWGALEGAWREPGEACLLSPVGHGVGAAVPVPCSCVFLFLLQTLPISNNYLNKHPENLKVPFSSKIPIISF